MVLAMPNTRAMPHAIASGYDVAARCQRDILPLRKIISDELMLRSGAMQVDVFVLPAEARQKIADTVTVK
jgi:hypothetical protein